jgi:hypothetical protein
MRACGSFWFQAARHSSLLVACIQSFVSPFVDRLYETIGIVPSAATRSDINWHLIINSDILLVNELIKDAGGGIRWL